MQMSQKTKFIYEDKNSIYTNPYLKKNRHNMSSTNTSTAIDYKTLFEEEKQLKETALAKVEKINTTAILIINKLQQENVRLKDEKSKLVEEKKDLFEKNMKLIEENKSFIIHNQILITEKTHLERVYQELSDFMMFLSDFFGNGFEVAKNIFYNNYYYHNYIMSELEPNLDIYSEQQNDYLVTENEIEIKNESESEMTDVVSIGTNSLTDEEDYDNYLLDKEKCNNFIYHQNNC
jgi:hypothetical protein